MPEVVFSVDQSKSMRDQAVPGHNRWHPDVPPAASVRPGSEFRVECREWTDAQLGNNDSANDVRDVDLTHAHMLSGPVEIQGAEPGDLLVVDILDLGPVPQETGPAPGQGWGYTGIFAKDESRIKGRVTAASSTPPCRCVRLPKAARARRCARTRGRSTPRATNRRPTPCLPRIGSSAPCYPASSQATRHRQCRSLWAQVPPQLCV
jgi:hypothetical protein